MPRRDKEIEKLIELSKTIEESIAKTTKPSPATTSTKPTPRPQPRGMRR